MQKPSVPISHVLKHLVVMCAVAAVLGVVVAGIAIPFAGVVGLGAKNAAEAVDKLPAEFETGDLDQTTKIVDANGNLIAKLFNQNREYRSLDKISRKMAKSMIAIEDYRFYEHGAMDLKGTLRAFVTNSASGDVQGGGSSITQQLVKTTLTYNAKNKKERKEATENTYARKLRELRYSIALEQKHSKDWILERYLNAAYFGNGAYGVQAAAKKYFNVDASKLNWKQSATLAGLVKNPTGYSPTSYPDAAIARRNVVLDRMAQLNVIPQNQAEKFKNQGLALDVTKDRNGCVNSSAPFFCEYVLKYLYQDPAFGDTQKQRKARLESGGFIIKTTMRPAFQHAATKSVMNNVYPTDQAIGGIAEVEPGTGNVLALAQSRPIGNKIKQGETWINYTTPNEIGGSRGFSPGSTFKLFVLAAALEQGIPLSTTLNAQENMSFPVSSFSNCPGQDPFVGENWNVSNSTGTNGRMDAYTGTQKSVNTYFAQLEQMTGVCAPYALAKKMGINLTNPTGTGGERFPPFVLGTGDASPLEMAEAYATFGGRGKHCDSKPVTEIQDANGKLVKTYSAKCQQVLKESTADAVADVLRGVQEPGGFGYSYGTSIVQSNGTVIPSAAKTGTAQDGKAVWYVGFTPQVGTAAMIAGANQLGQPQGLSGVSVAGGYHNPSGSGFAGPMWAGAMDPVADLLDPVPFGQPTDESIEGIQVDVPSVGGLTVAEAKKKIEAAGFTALEGGSTYSDYAVGTVAATDPWGTAGKGTAITIYTSAGPEPEKPKKKPGDGGRDGGGGDRDGGGGDGDGGGGGGDGNRDGGND